MLIKSFNSERIQFRGEYYENWYNRNRGYL